MSFRGITVLLDHIPLINTDHQTLSEGGRLFADLDVLNSHPFNRVEQENRHIAARQAGRRPKRAVILNLFSDLRLPSQARGINQKKGSPIPLHS